MMEKRDWVYPMPPLVVEEFEFICRQYRIVASDLRGLRYRRDIFPQMGLFAKALRNQVLDAEGLALIRGMHKQEWDEDQRVAFYVVLSSALGNLMPEYGIPYEVSDRGQSYVDSSVPVSQTCAATGYHTDSSSVSVNPDIVGLYCQEPGSEGGDSVVSNARRAVAMLEREVPEAASVLARNFIRDIVTPGSEGDTTSLLANRFPIYENGVFRYMRFWIERGHRKAGQPLGDAILTLLDRLDANLDHEDNMIQFRLDKGDMVFVNNRRLAHGRTAYEDTGESRRVLQRVWIDCA